MTSGASRAMCTTCAGAETGSGTGAVTILRSETIRAWQAWIMSEPSLSPPNTLPSTRRTLQVPRIPLRQSCGRSTPFIIAPSSKRSPTLATKLSSLTVTVQDFFRIISFHFKSDGPDMAGMPDLAVIEGRDPHESAALQRHVVLAVGVELARHLERPVPAGPARRTAHVGAVAGEVACEDHTRQHRALGDQFV